MNYKGGASLGERVALRDIARYQEKTIKDLHTMRMWRRVITSSYLYNNGVKIRKQNDKLYKTFG